MRYPVSVDPGAQARATVPLRRLLAAEAELNLAVLTAPANHGRLPIAWTATSELVDPTPFLDGTELLLTTGALLDADDEPALAAYVARLADRGIRVLGFGVKLSHDRTPSALITHAAESRMTLLEVPLETPFVAIARLVADEVAAQEYAAVTQALDTHQRLVAALTDGEGLSSMIVALYEITGSPCCVMDFYGTVLARAPERVTWPIELVVHRRETTPWALEDMSAHPVLLEGQPVATLLVRAAADADGSLQTIGQAIGLIAIELAKRRDTLSARRESLGLVLEDVLRGLVRGRDAVEKLERFGIDLASSHTVVVARIPGPSQVLRRSPWNLQVELDRATRHTTPLVATCDDEVIVIHPEDADPEDVAKQLAGRLRDFLVNPVSIGVGNPYPGLEGLRLSHAEASAVARRAPGINTAGRMRLADLMVASSSPGVQHLASTILQPLREHDDATGSELVVTLRTFLEEAGSTGEAARRMVVHRNTIIQRIRRIRELTGIDPTSLPNAAELWLALAHDRREPG